MIEVESNLIRKRCHMPVRWDLCAYASECEGDGCEESLSPAESIEGGVKELSGYLKKNNGDLVLALAFIMLVLVM